MSKILPTQINGQTYPDLSNVVIRVPGAADLHVTTINYSRSVSREKVIVNGRRSASGYTSGEVEYTADFEMLKPDGDAFIRSYASMGPDASFSIIVTYALPPSTQNPVPLTITDTLQACRVDEVSSAASSGGGPVTSSFSLSLPKILFNGLDLDGAVL